MKKNFPEVPSLFEAVFRSGYWRHGSALLRLIAPYLAGIVLAVSYAGLSMSSSWWWVWIAGALFIVMLIVKFTTTPAGLVASTPPCYAIPVLLVLGGNGLFMIVNGIAARVVVGVLFCFSLIIVLRAIIRGQAHTGVGNISHAAAVVFSSSLAVFSTAVSAALLVILINFPSFGAVAAVFLSCLGVIRQVLWWISQNEKYPVAWVWALSLICTELFILVLLLPLPIVSGGALMWLVYSGMIELYRLRIKENYTRKNALTLSAVYTMACIALLLTARWP